MNSLTSPADERKRKLRPENEKEYEHEEGKKEEVKRKRKKKNKKKKPTLDAANQGLEQGYYVVPSSMRLIRLYSFLLKNSSKKVMVFFSSPDSLKFHSDILRRVGLEVMDLHGGQDQQKRNSTYSDFCQAEKGVLLCTNAALNFVMPSVDLILQYDPPKNPKEYIDRIGRTSLGKGGKGTALLFVIPKELQYITYLKDAKVAVKEYKFDEKELGIEQSALEEAVEKDSHLKMAAKEAYRTYIEDYRYHAMKDIFDLGGLDRQGVAASFGLNCPPLRRRGK